MQAKGVWHPIKAFLYTAVMVAGTDGTDVAKGRAAAHSAAFKTRRACLSIEEISESSCPVTMTAGSRFSHHQ
jgi:hypothetical protein